MPASLDELFPESEFVFVPDVAIFKTHERFKGGKKVKITKTELEQIAANHTDKFNRLGIALPSSEGHTLDRADGDDVPEKEQPDITGWFVNYRVTKLPTDPDEDYLIADWYVRKDKAYVIRDYPTRSVELYPSKMELWPVANLKSSCPELDLPIVKYAQEKRPDEDPVQLTLTSPILYTSERNSMSDEKKPVDEPKKPDDAAMESAKKDSEQGSVQDKGDLADLKQMLAPLQELIPLIPDLMQLVQLMKEGPEGDDLMDPTDDMTGEPKPSPETGKGNPKPDEKDMAKKVEKPVEFSAMPSATNCAIPDDTQKKDAYAMKDDDVVKYRAELEAAQKKIAKLETDVAANQKVSVDLYKKNRRADAEKLVYKLETEHLIDFSDAKMKEDEIVTITRLDEKHVPEYFDRVKTRYQKKLPNSESVKDVAKYAADAEPDLGAKTPEEAQERALRKIMEMANAKK